MADDSAQSVAGPSVRGAWRRRIAARPAVAAILANAGWLAGDKVVRLGLGLLVGALVARALGPAQFGLLSFATALLALFGSVSSLGLDSILVRELVAQPGESDTLVGTAFTLKLMGAAAALLLGLVSVLALRPGDALSLQVAAILGIGQLFLAFDAIDFWFRSRLQSRYTVLAKNAAFLVASGVRLLLVWRGATVTSLAWASAAEFAVAGIALAAVYRRVAPGHMARWRSRRAAAVELLRHSWPLAFSGFVVAIYMRVDQVMLATGSGDAAVGVYSVAVRLAEVWFFIPSAITTSALPAILRARLDAPEVYRNRMQQLLVYMAGLGYVAAIAITLLGAPVVELLYGAAYRGSVLPLTVLAWAGVFVCLGVARESWMLAEGLTKLSLASTALGAAVNVLLNFVLIPTHGALGAAIATLLAQGVAVLLATVLFPKTRPMFVMLIHALSLGLTARTRKAA